MNAIQSFLVSATLIKLADIVDDAFASGNANNRLTSIVSESARRSKPVLILPAVGSLPSSPPPSTLETVPEWFAIAVSAVCAEAVSPASVKAPS